MTDERKRFARLTARIYREIRAEACPGENGQTTGRVEEALEMAERLAGEEPGYRPAANALRRMKRRRAR